MNRYVETIFCDDIRQEIGNKLSYVGTYLNNMYVAQFPAALAKFCVAIRVVTPASLPFSSLKIYIKKDNEVLAEIVPEIEYFAKGDQLRDKIVMDSKDKTAEVAQFIAAFSPFRLDQPCSLRVLVETENEELKGLGLKVEQQPTNAHNENTQRTRSSTKKKSTKTSK